LREPANQVILWRMTREAQPIHEARRNPGMGRREALELFRRAVSGLVQFHGPDLTVRQLAMLSCIHLSRGPHTVRGLADQLGVTKAVIVRGIDTLCQLGFVERRPDPRDKRSILIVPALRGAAYLNHVGDLVARAANQGALRDQAGSTAADPDRVAGDSFGEAAVDDKKSAA
jgi:DNA-binding MarR family transcriptional regulator